MELDLFVASANEMVDNVGGGCVSASATEPLVARQALDDAAGVMDATIPRIPTCQLLI